MTAGISYVAAMIGFFGVAEVLMQLHELKVKAVKQDVSKILPSWRLLKKYLPLSLRTSGIGVVVGALPGAGGDIAALMAYDHAKRTVKNPSRPFGEGAYEGLVAPESANNAAVGGAYIPMMTLGIPGDAVTAVIIGAMTIHGLKPGPMLMVETPHLFWFMVGSLTLANCFLLVFGLTGIKLFAKIVETPKAILLPVILVLSAVGAYAINNNPVDVYWMLGFGVFGYFLKMYGFQVGPVILGMILGPLMDKSYRQAMISAEENLGQFAAGFVSSPLSAIILFALTLTIASQTRWWKRMRGKT
jgi:putative tricarboxylic transport membrane protein